jgi:hypothetical protein
MEASQHFHETYIEEENSSEGNGTAGDTVQFHITALYVPDVGTSTPGGAQ